MWSTNSASDPSPLMSRSHICYHSLYALHSIMLLLMVIMMIRIKIETKSKLSYIKQATQFQFSKRNFSNIAFWLSCGVKWNEVAERAEQTKTLFVHISQVSSSLFLIFLWESICTRCHVTSIFMQNINWNCLHSRSLSYTTSKCSGRWKTSLNITWDSGNKKCVCKHYKRFSRQL